MLEAKLIPGVGGGSGMEVGVSSSVPGGPLFRILRPGGHYSSVYLFLYRPFPSKSSPWGTCAVAFTYQPDNAARKLG